MKYLSSQTRQNRQNPPFSMNIFSKCLKSGVTKPTKLDYSSLALGKISKLALVGYEYSAHTVRLMDFFCMCIFSMRSHVMAELEGEAFALASLLIDWSTNPFQLCHPHLVVNGEASKYQLGAHAVMPQIHISVCVFNINKKVVTL